MARSTVSRSLEICRKRGWPCAKLEYWQAVPGHPAGGVRKDLWGVGDLIALDPDKQGALLIQSTAGQGDVAKHIAKLTALVRDWEPPKKHPDLPEPISTWLAQGCRFSIWSWAKRGAKGKRKLWTVVETGIGPDDLASMIVTRDAPF